MESISKALEALITGDDLSSLPSLVAKVAELESQETGYIDRIGRLQELNKQYLSQIPIPGQEPKEEEVEVDETATIADAQAYLIEALGGK